MYLWVIILSALKSHVCFIVIFRLTKIYRYYITLLYNSSLMTRNIHGDCIHTKSKVTQHREELGDILTHKHAIISAFNILRYNK